MGKGKRSLSEMVGYVVSLSRTISRREFQAAGSSSSCLRGGRGWGGRGRRRSRRTMVVCTVKGRLEGEEEKEEENRLEAGGGTEDRTSPWKIILTVAPFIICEFILHALEFVRKLGLGSTIVIFRRGGSWGI